MHLSVGWWVIFIVEHTLSISEIFYVIGCFTNGTD